MSQTVRNLLIAIALAIVGIFLTTMYVSSKERSITEGQESVEVIVATKDIPAGTPANRLEADGFVEVSEVLREDAAPQHMSQLKTLTDEKKGVGKRSVNATIFEGEQLTGRNFADSTGLNPADSIKGTQRIMMVPLNPQGSVGGQLLPGDRVDLVATVEYLGVADQPGVGPVTEPLPTVIIRDVLVVQTPESLNGAVAEEEAEAMRFDDDPQMFGLQVSDEQAMQIVWAQSRGGENKNAEYKGFVALLRPSNNANETDISAADVTPEFVQDNFRPLSSTISN